MPIEVTQIDCDHPIELAHWSARDETLLIKIIAWLILGRRAHAVGIMAGDADEAPELTHENINEAIGHLRCPEQVREISKGKFVPHNSVIHRDGWLYQFISWIVARGEFPDSIQRAPQSRKADKGFDGLLIGLDGSSIRDVVIVEDKATDDPRGTVTDDIWPEFRAFEGSSRDNDLTAEASTMLERLGLDPRALTKKARWFNIKRYRASVATSKANIPPKVHTFAGYDGVIGGETSRRLGNLMVVEELRPFMEDLANKIIGYLETLRPADV